MADNKAINIIKFPTSETIEFKNWMFGTARTAVELYGDDQGEVARHIRQSLKSKEGGKWVVLVCPKDNKTYSINLDVITNNHGEERVYLFDRENKKFLIAKTD